MGFLRAFGFGGELTRFGAEVVGTILGFHAFSGRYDRLLGEMDRIRSHVRNVAIFIQTLSRTHGVSRRKANFTVGFLLER